MPFSVLSLLVSNSFRIQDESRITRAKTQPAGMELASKQASKRLAKASFAVRSSLFGLAWFSLTLCLPSFQCNAMLIEMMMMMHPKIARGRHLTALLTFFSFSYCSLPRRVRARRELSASLHDFKKRMLLPSTTQ